MKFYFSVLITTLIVISGSTNLPTSQSAIAYHYNYNAIAKAYRPFPISS